ncbi:DLW-39 family protein [Brachybacterium sp. GPGPB12]|uniref:DLW-39 family protein n=1 Tax=Brachybacterium sp. GPGPB12 TaxID=3023517 RepID=UPI0031342F66
MKKFITTTAVVLTTAVAGILTWRKVESDRIRNDLWNEAERVSVEQDMAAQKQAQALLIRTGAAGSTIGTSHGDLAQLVER